MARQILESRHPSLAGITLEELKARGWMCLNYPDPFVPFANGFRTPSGKLEFVSWRMAPPPLPTFNYGWDTLPESAKMLWIRPSSTLACLSTWAYGAGLARLAYIAIASKRPASRYRFSIKYMIGNVTVGGS